MRNHREALPFKLISNQLIFLWVWNGWIIFSILNTTKKFATSFPPLTLHIANLMLWKKILSLIFLKFITITRLSTTLRIFVMEKWGCSSKRGRERRWTLVGELHLLDQKFELHPSVGYHPYQKTVSPCSTPD